MLQNTENVLNGVFNTFCFEYLYNKSNTIEKMVFIMYF